MPKISTDVCILETLVSIMHKPYNLNLRFLRIIKNTLKDHFLLVHILRYTLRKEQSIPHWKET